MRDMTGWTALTILVKRNEDDIESAAVYSLNGTLDTSDSSMSFKFPAEPVGITAGGNFWWELMVTDDAADPQRLAAGPCVVTRGSSV